MKEYLYILSICVFCAVTPLYTNHATDGNFYTTNALWSLAVIYGVLWVQKTLFTICICIVECLLMIFGYMASLGYNQYIEWGDKYIDLSEFNIYHDNYPLISNTLNTIEGLILITWICINRRKIWDGVVDCWERLAGRLYKPVWMVSIIHRIFNHGTYKNN